MGTKRTSIRTLADGSRVHHIPPDPQHPNGVLKLIRDRSPLREKLAASRHKKKQRHGLIHARHLQKIDIKKTRQKAKGLPNEKSPI